ncbi:uncharacterized protein [Macrobrachium rosenbergii]|uniref:uncharacterized protein n=1 Tax=Macrobrachium rosenbergii TaxID=79674 RepID=UPI0034D39326
MSAEQGISPNHVPSPTRCTQASSHLPDLLLASEDPVLRVPMGARLLHFWRKWEVKSVEPWVIEVLREGYSIPFNSKPPLALAPINLTAYSIGSQRFLALSKEVTSLLKKMGYRSCERRELEGFYNSFFIIPKSSGGWRSVLDLSALNFFIKTTKFRMEANQSVLSSIHQGDWMVTIDIKDAFFHIPVHPESRKYLRLMAQGRVLASVAKRLSLMGINICLYLNNWLLCSLPRNRYTEDLQKTLPCPGFGPSGQLFQVTTSPDSVDRLFRDDDRLSEFSGFSVTENSYLPADDSEISRSSFLLNQRVDEPLGHFFIPREACAIRETALETPAVLPEG